MEDLIKEFRVTISNILLYPPESTLIKKSLERCVDVLNKVLEKDKSLTISESEGSLLINGEPLKVSSGIFLDSLVSLKIKSIIFKPGFTSEELYAFLQDLATKHKPESSPNIEISEKLYVPVSKKDLIIEVSGELKEKVVKITTELSTLIDSVEDKEVKGKIKLEVARLLGLKPELEAKIIEPKKPEEIQSQAEPAPSTPAEEANRLLNVDSKFLLDEGMLQRVDSLLQSLHSPRELKLASDLCNKLAENLEAGISDIRLKAVISFKKLYSTLEILRDKNIVKNIDLKLVKVGRQETDSEVYREITTLLSRAANRYLREGNYEDTHTITGMLSEHAKSSESEDKRRHAKATIDRLVGSEFTRLLVDDLSSDDAHKRTRAASILLDIGEPCVHPLIVKIKETADLRLRKAIADLLVKIGNSAVKELVSSLKEATDFQSALRILDVLDGIGHEQLVVDALRRQLSNPNFYIRRRVLELFYQIGTDYAKQALLEAIEDESHIIKERAIEFLGNLRYKSAVPRLVQIIEKPDKSDKESIQEEACRALGNIGDESAIPALFKVASPRALFYTGKPRAIRMAAVEALVKLGDPRALKFVDDKDPFISKATKELLKERELNET